MIVSYLKFIHNPRNAYHFLNVVSHQNISSATAADAVNKAREYDIDLESYVLESSVDSLGPLNELCITIQGLSLMVGQRVR